MDHSWLFPISRNNENPLEVCPIFRQVHDWTCSFEAFLSKWGWQPDKVMIFDDSFEHEAMLSLRHDTSNGIHQWFAWHQNEIVFWRLFWSDELTVHLCEWPTLIEWSIFPGSILSKKWNPVPRGADIESMAVIVPCPFNKDQIDSLLLYMTINCNILNFSIVVSFHQIGVHFAHSSLMEFKSWNDGPGPR